MAVPDPTNSQFLGSMVRNGGVLRSRLGMYLEEGGEGEWVGVAEIPDGFTQQQQPWRAGHPVPVGCTDFSCGSCVAISFASEEWERCV